MAGSRPLTAAPRGVRFAVLCAAVVVAHILVLAWVRYVIDASSLLRPMPAPMYSRLLQPDAPAPMPVPQAKPDARVTRPARPSVTSIASEASPAPPVALASDAGTTPADKPASQPTPEPALQPASAASAAADPVNAPDAATVATAPTTAGSQVNTTGPTNPETWPTDTQLTYNVTGYFRGPLNGTAHVQWQRDGTKYQVRVDVKVQPIFTYTFTSQGDIEPAGLSPRAYEEVRPGGKARGVKFTADSVVRDNGSSEPRPPGVQDTASQFIELSHRFQMGQEPLQVPGVVSVHLARPGGVDLWTYDIVAREVLTIYAGPTDTFHLKPRPLANPRGNIYPEMWFAPSLLYLPVRIKLNMGEDVYLDLVVEKIEQAR
ncbi:DUF3108 domain-containing protein [Caenimonas koreensis]|uniref:DUF3108 domain-containing protein n=1 Tax=Caenimonas koreensis TaxID=367474 RepID=UPI0037850296